MYRNKLEEFIQRVAVPSYRYAHIKRVYQLAKRLDIERTSDDDVLFAAAMLHDVGTYPEFRPANKNELERWDHIKFACDFSTQFLAQTGFPAEKIPPTIEVIRLHNFSSNPGANRNAIILRDADILDFLGPVGIVRILIRVESDTRVPDIKSAIEWIKRNLDELPGRLTTEQAIQVAAGRRQEMIQFLAWLSRDTDGLKAI